MHPALRRRRDDRLGDLRRQEHGERRRLLEHLSDGAGSDLHGNPDHGISLFLTHKDTNADNSNLNPWFEGDVIRADLDLHINLLAEHELSRLTALVRQVAERVGVEPANDIAEIERDVRAEDVLDTLDRVTPAPPDA